VLTRHATPAIAAMPVGLALGATCPVKVMAVTEKGLALKTSDGAVRKGPREF
jgi:hypothetical protein